MPKLNGNTDGIKNSLLEQIKSLYDIKCEDEFAPFELLSAMAEYTGFINREISVYISRAGNIVDVSIGDSGKVNMPSMRLVRNEDRLCGVRCIHSHPNGDGRLSGVDIGTLKSIRLDCMAALGVNEGKPAVLYAGFLGELKENGDREALIYGPLRPNRLPQRALINEIYAADARFKSTTKEVTDIRQERAILAGLENDEHYDTMQELAQLAQTANVEVAGSFTQRRKGADNATYLGSGKAEELALKASELEADIFIFDDELNAVQLKNLEELLGVRVIDRTTLILDIFAARATSREGKLQVELAQQKYRLPRLLGQGTSLSRLGGGIGTRGPGEKKLEIDRRRIRERIVELEQELAEISRQRGLRRDRRIKRAMPLIALVGYTNAGKSTLLNAITGAGVLAEDKLFATLDPVIRQISLPGGSEALVADTVGFINKLPHDLIEAFKSTLEEVSNADVILHVVDSSSDYYESQMRVVEQVLSELGAGDIPRINVYNKQDKTAGIKINHEGCIGISAKTGEGIKELLTLVEAPLNKGRIKVSLKIPYSKYEAMNLIRTEGALISEANEADGVHVEALLYEPTLGRLKKLLNN